jgi:hypothetical protein
VPMSAKAKARSRNGPAARVGTIRALACREASHAGRVAATHYPAAPPLPVLDRCAICGPGRLAIGRRSNDAGHGCRGVAEAITRGTARYGFSSVVAVAGIFDVCPLASRVSR